MSSHSVVIVVLEFGLVLAGPEAPLLACLADDLVKAGIPAFGPSSEAAALQ